MPHLPSFALADPYVTAHVTYADLFSHVSGLPDHSGDLLEDLGYDRAYILARLRLEPPDPFPGGYPVHQLRSYGRRRGGRRRRWAVVADLADDILFGPVGMPASSFRYSDFLKEADRAAMHVRDGERWVQKYTRDADPEALVAPAPTCWIWPTGGSCNSPVAPGTGIRSSVAMRLARRICRTRCPRCPVHRSAAVASTGSA